MRSRVAVRGERRINANDPHPPQSRHGRRVHVLCADGGESARTRRAVLEGQADLGLLIHEGQITYQTMGLTKVLDLGEAWQRDTGLPLPLGCNVMRRDLGDDLHRALSQALRDSIAWAHAHVDEALEY